MDGSGWKEYQQSGEVCGIPLPEGLKQCDQLPEPIFTPATKEETGHDINISFETMVGDRRRRRRRKNCAARSIELYQQGAAWAREKGIIIADTKFEWGYRRRRIDSDRRGADSRQLSFLARRSLRARPRTTIVRQAVCSRLAQRDRLGQEQRAARTAGDVVAKTREKYIEAYERLTGPTFAWK